MRAALLALLLLGCPSAAPGDAGPDAADAPRTYVPEPFAPTAETIAYCGARDDAAIEARITELLAELTPDEKIDLLAGDGLRDGTWEVSGVPRLGLPGLHMLDGPRGLSSFTGLNGTAFPVAILRGASWDPALEERVGRAMALEHRSAGADVILAPTMNLLRHPRWGRAQETYSEDSHHMGAMALAFVRGVQREGVIASAKHYAANSIEDTRHTVDVVIDPRTLREVYLPHFERVVVEGRVGSVMSAYNRVNGLYCDEQPLLLQTILREEWGFAGFVESDWIWGTHGDVSSLRAGLDIEMPSEVEFRGLRRALRSGALDERDVDRAVRRVLRAMLCFGLDEAAPRTPGTRIDRPEERETAEHLALAREVARRGLVLLRNGPAAAPLLPLDPAAHAAAGAVVLLGRNAERENIGDEGSSAVDPSDVVTAREGLEARLPAGAVVAFAALDDAARAAIAAAETVVIVTGLTAEDEGESDIAAGDRETLALPEAEVALVRAVAALTDRLVVVLEGGAAITSAAWDGETEALLFAGYPGSEGGHALAEVLFGDHPPTGRLPFSVPVAEGDLPPFDNVSEEVVYGYLHGYRHLLSEATPAHYPFGFGLSTTRFILGAPRLLTPTVGATGTVELEVDVTNEGPRAGTETVQLYVAAVGSRVPRAPRDLRAFAQLTLAPGETGTVTLRVPARDLRFWDEEASSYEVEAIAYDAFVGTDAERTTGVVRFTVEGG